MSRVLVEITDKVATLTLNDPDKRNALDAEMSSEVAATIREIDASDDVGAVVVTGAGKGFCAGGSLGALLEGAQSGGENMAAIRHEYTALYEAFLELRSARVPTVAAVNGAAVGAGLNLALAADVTIAGESAKFMSGFLRLGLHPGGGNTSMLTERIGPQAAAAMTLFGETIDGREAERIGLAYRCVADADLLGTAQAMATVAADYPADATKRVKETLRLARTADFQTVLDTEVTAQIWTATLPEAAERLAAMQKR